ncbi:hypothetical protein I2I05_11135 [Hymenobacter sp. BT683]|uniref:Lipoprotein n=1 Tax=Hymenobacter jeongseonensis TaxID=2791027 RepID=A0ABS0IHV2_9BACT|nr:hypothetical protein [Hymenobacter jeongseonensis]MBF9237948.1 hypothetical protein [Hymenobacter jeongseonensis]
MNLFRTLSSAALICLTAAGLTSCLTPPDYPDEPEIEFKSLTKIYVPSTGGQLAADTLLFAIDFKDGDGDLGLSDEDITNAPFNTTTGGPNNRGYQYNYFIQPFKKNASSGVFEPFIAPGGEPGEYDGRYPRLDGDNGEDAKPAPLRGTLRYKLPLFLDGFVFSPGDVFRFEISIMDRELHQSNKVTTSEVTLGQ